MIPKPMRVVLLGPPASGKGTQGRRLADSLGLAYLSTGALLRSEVAAASDLGKRAEPFLARGEFLPDELMCPILGDWLAKQTHGWVLDGFPRSLPQAVFLDEWLAQRSLAVDVAVSLEVPFSELLARMKTGSSARPAAGLDNVHNWGRQTLARSANVRLDRGSTIRRKISEIATPSSPPSPARSSRTIGHSSGFVLVKPSLIQTMLPQS
jgi:adenylate kinase family enzyme